MEEIDLKELIDMFLAKKILIIIVILISAILGALYTTKLLVPKYDATTSLVLVQGTGEKNISDSDSITATDLALNSKLVNNYREIAKSETVLSKVIENLKLDMSVADLREIIIVNSKTDTELIEISVTDADPKLAAEMANEIAKIFIERTDEIYKINNVHILDKAKIPEEPSNIHLSKNIVIFSFVGFILVSAYILLINMLDTTVKTDLDIEKALHVPVLASIMLSDDSNKKKHKSVSIQEDVEISFQDENKKIENTRRRGVKK